ncbi:MAG: hypothetical protein KGH95_05000 [Thaumarchaeota archaeon]|nr:hypothetical protein [Nitrososphaerota archaeon]
MAVKKIAYLVFVFPVIASLVFGGYVLSDVLGQPDRQLNMWQFKPTAHFEQQGDSTIRFTNLVANYTVSTPMNFRVMVNDTSFDCGDLYLTIYNPNTSPQQIVVQHAYFSQCFTQGNSDMPIQDTFNPVIDKAGIYEIQAEMKDKTYEKSISVKADFRVQ